MTLADRIFRLLQRHRGADCAISAPQICAELGESNERQIRREIDEHSARWPQLVCSLPGQGYFIAQTFEEAQKCDSWLSDLAQAALVKRDAFRSACARMGLRVPTPTEERAAA